MTINSKIINYFFKQAEIGNWDKVNLIEVEKKLKLKKNVLNNLLSDKIFFLKHYDRFIDQKVMKSISREDIDESTSDEIIQEYIMNKLDFMNEHKFGISNIINYYYKNPKFILISLKSSKKSMTLYLKKISSNNSIIQQKLLEKAILIVYLFAFKKWLYEDNSNNSSFALIDKGIKRIKKATNFF